MLQLLSEGKSTMQFSIHVGASAKTVETYRQQMMEQLDIHIIAQLTKYVIRKGLIALEA